jgi:hypothetical protein
LSLRDPNGQCGRSDQAAKFVDQGGLADSRFPGDEDGLPLTVGRVL